VQEAGIAALTGPQDSVVERVNAYRRRRDRVLEVIPGGICQGTFFVWFPLPEGWTAERILEELRVAVAPGEGFGSRGAGWARLSLAVTDETLELGLERLARLAGDS
jgi:aspartate/methionine/tyrosine aminotransferase